MSYSVLIAVWAFSTLVTVDSAGSKSLSYGMAIVTRAYDTVCWYEYLKNFPKTNTKHYIKCQSAARQKKDNLENPSEQNRKYMNARPGNDIKLYGEWMGNAMKYVPELYKNACEPFLKNHTAKVPADESDVLKDRHKHGYPYKGFAYCLVNTLRKTHGVYAIDSVKNERTHRLKHWKQTILDRENEFRARHGSKPLHLVKALSEEAQKWANQNADKCLMHHSKTKDPGRIWKDKSTGESLACSTGQNNSQIAAYLGINGWYEEIKDYPYPLGYQGNGQDELFPKIGHFTQTVWRNTEYVGYGYAFNPKCEKQGKMTRYLVSRYGPPGNMRGQYNQNVHPPRTHISA